jgi:3-oxoacyl-[acyl-carrier protein] reductase
MDLGLHNKVVIISGASRGIGRATALRFAAEGARLVLNHRQDGEAMAQTLQACRELGAEAEGRRADVGEKGTAEGLIDLALDRFGQLDVLVNNAGQVKDELLAMTDDEALEAQIATNIGGLVRMSRAAVKPMLRQRSGCIINLSSALATRPGRGNSVYAGTKGFVESFTRALAVELGRKNIRVNAVAPGVIETDMTSAVRALAQETIPERIGLRRIGQADEVAATILFLASAQAAYLNGAVVPIDGAFLGGM